MEDCVYPVSKNIDIILTPAGENINQYLFCLAGIKKDSEMIGFIYYYGLAPIQMDIGVLVNDTKITITSGNIREWSFELSLFNESTAKRITAELYWLPVTQKQFILKDTDKDSFVYNIETCTLLDYMNTIIEGRSDIPAFQNNVFLSIENTGVDEVSITDILINGRSWWTLEGILNDIGLDMSDKTGFEVIKKIWDFTRKKISCGKTYQHLFSDEMSKISIVDFFNCFGTGACGTYSSILALLSASCGIPARRGSLSDGSHVISQVMLENRDFVLDAFYGADSEGEGVRGSFFINHNGHPASYDDLCKDHYLVNRSGRLRIGELASLFGYNDSWQNTWTENYSDSKFMNLTLYSGENIKWNIHPIYSQKGNEARQTGVFQLSKKLHNHRYKSFNLIINENTVKAEDAGSLNCKLSLPYPIYGINCNVRLISGSIKIEINTGSGSIFKEYSCEFEDKPMQINFKPDTNDCDVLFNDITQYTDITISSGPKTLYEVEKLECLFYAYGKSLAILKSGINSCLLKFKDKSNVKNLIINHGFLEFPEDSLPVPNTPEVSAEDYYDTAGNKIIKLIFKSPKSIENLNNGYLYEYIISDNPECSIPVSPKHQELTYKKDVFLENNGILIPDTIYYVKARSINPAGVTSPWSKTTNFSIKSIPAPVWDNTEYLQNGVKIKWKPVKSPGQSIHYDIFGSCEKGFKPSKVPYDVWVKRIYDPVISDRYQGNFICTTTKTSLIIPLENAGDEMAVPAHFRIAARTNLATGVPGDMLSLITPYMLKSSIPSVIFAGQPFNSSVKTILSRGSLHFNRLPDKPINTSFLYKEIPFYELIESPSWININSHEGCLYGTPDITDRGHHNITIICKTHLGICKTETSIEVV